MPCQRLATDLSCLRKQPSFTTNLHRVCFPRAREQENAPVSTQSIKGKPVLALHECSTPHAWLLLQNLRRGHKRSERECPKLVRRAETASLALAVLLHLPFFLHLH